MPLQAWFRRALAHEGLHRLDAARHDARQAIATARSAPGAELLLRAPPQHDFTGSQLISKLHSKGFVQDLHLMASLLCLCIPQSVDLISRSESDTGYALQMLDVLQACTLCLQHGGGSS